jgi:hypothetical protein
MSVRTCLIVIVSIDLKRVAGVLDLCARMRIKS